MLYHISFVLLENRHRRRNYDVENRNQGRHTSHKKVRDSTNQGKLFFILELPLFHVVYL